MDACQTIYFSRNTNAIETKFIYQHRVTQGRVFDVFDPTSRLQKGTHPAPSRIIWSCIPPIKFFISHIPLNLFRSLIAAAPFLCDQEHNTSAMGGSQRDGSLSVRRECRTLCGITWNFNFWYSRTKVWMFENMRRNRLSSTHGKACDLISWQHIFRSQFHIRILKTVMVRDEETRVT